MRDSEFARLDRANDAYEAVSGARDRLQAMLPPESPADQNRWNQAIAELDVALRLMKIRPVSDEDLDLLREPL